jgi:hypothetical protein
MREWEQARNRRAAVWRCSSGKAEQGFAGDALQLTLRFSFRVRLKPSVGQQSMHYMWRRGTS